MARSTSSSFDASLEAGLVKLGIPIEKDAIYHMLEQLIAALDPESSLRVNDGNDPLDILGNVLDARQIASVGISVNDEAISVDIARFSGGTVVGRCNDAFDSGGIEFILPNATLEQVESEAYAALANMQDGADWVLYEEGEEEPEDGEPAEVFGFSELRRTWQTLTNSSTRERERS